MKTFILVLCASLTFVSSALANNYNSRGRDYCGGSCVAANGNSITDRGCEALGNYSGERGCRSSKIGCMWIPRRTVVVPGTCVATNGNRITDSACRAAGNYGGARSCLSSRLGCSWYGAEVRCE